MLKELISDKKAPQSRRLQAGETLLEVYRRHDETERRREARKQPTETQGEPVTQEPSDVATVPEVLDPQQAALAFLERMRRKGADAGTDE